LSVKSKNQKEIKIMNPSLKDIAHIWFKRARVLLALIIVLTIAGQVSASGGDGNQIYTAKERQKIIAPDGQIF
jgi:hypothetical protein